MQIAPTNESTLTQRQAREGRTRAAGRLGALMLIGLLATAMPLVGRLPAAGAQPPGGGRNFSPEDIERFRQMRDQRRGERRGNGGEARPSEGGQGGEGGEQPSGEEQKPEGEKSEEEKKEPEIPTVKRPTQPDAPPNPAELRITPDADGRVEFSFSGQPWKDVLQWYADVSRQSFDWQELPDGFLNLTTTRRYTLRETRDLLNRHLLARGFTMLAEGDVITAVKIDKLDPSLVPRVDPDDLEDYLPYDFVRTRFSLPTGMDPAKASEDVKLLLSPNAKVVPLLATRRLMVIDAVANLRDVRDILYAEQSAVHEDVRPHVFMIRHRRADYIADQVMIVLGLDPASRKSPQELQIEQQRLQLFQQLAQRGRDVTNMLAKEGPPVFLAVDKIQNTVLVNAPPDQMAIIDRTIKQLDVPADGGEVADDGRLEMRRYKTVTASTDSLISALKDIGNLHPLTQLQADSRSKTVFAYATAADHRQIEALIEKLDGSGRTLRVVPLSRRTAADQVAGSIKSLLVGEEESGGRSRRGRWDWWNQEEESDEGKLRVQADIENNRLLLWVTDAEYEEIESLLLQIGAIAPQGGGRAAGQTRVLQGSDPEETRRMLEQLQRVWKGKNPLRIQPAPAAPERPQPAPAEAPERVPRNTDPRDQVTQTGVSYGGGPAGKFHLASHQTATEAVESPATAPVDASEGAEPVATEEASADRAADEAPPIDIAVTPDGRIVLSSDDPLALDQMEELLQDLAPPTQEFAIFHLVNSRASLVSLNLEEYFEEELGDSGRSYSRWSPWGSDDDESASLANRRKLRFIWDSDTNSIVVQNATPAQLTVIRQLIDIYDQPVGEDSVAKRRTEAIKLKYSRASDVATSLKEVYRDLLSSKDKEFQGREGERSMARSQTFYRFYGVGDDASDTSTAPVKIGFEGALSVGVDEVSNSLIISAEETVWHAVRMLVQQLDEAARPNTTIQVHEVQSSIPSARLRQVLMDAISQPWPGGRPGQQGGSRSSRGGESSSGDESRTRPRSESRDSRENGSSERWRGRGGGGQEQRSSRGR